MDAGCELLTPIVEDSALHRHFRSLITGSGHIPAQEMLSEVFRRFPSPDGNLIRDFQTAGFDARIWELYVAAVGLCTGFDVQRPHDRPDFLFERHGVRAWIECVTANPSQIRPDQVPKPGDGEEAVIRYYEHEVPVRLGGALYSKLTKVPPYWELPHVKGESLVFAIADFSDPGWFRTNAGALTRYLFGLEAHVISPPGHPMEIVYQPIGEHDGSKKIPSGFFDLPGAEKISAIFFSCEGTLPKFNRMGFDFSRHPFVRMTRVGGKYSFDSRVSIPTTFSYLVGDFSKEWRHGVSVFHNPRALHPIPFEFFHGFAQHWREGDQLNNRMSEFSPMSSLTLVFAKKAPAVFSPSEDEMLRRLVQVQAQKWDAIQAMQAGYPWRPRS